MTRRANALVVFTNSDNGELLAEQIATAALPTGRSFFRKKSTHMLHAIQAIPPDHRQEIVSLVANSPTYMRSLMLAAESGAVQNSNLQEQPVTLPDDLFRDFIEQMIRGQISPASAEQIVKQVAEQPAKVMPLDAWDRLIKSTHDVVDGKQGN